MNNLINAKEAAELLGVSDQTVINWIRDGRIPAQKVGRVWVISEDSLESVERPKVGRPPEVEAEGDG